MDGPDEAMHKDPNLRKRNALVIPGGLLTLVAVAGILYVVGLRGDAGTCEDAGLIVLAGACRSALLVLAIPLVIGLALLATGALRFRSKATCRLGHGSWAHFGLAFLVTLTVLPLLGALLSPSLVGEDAAIVNSGVRYPVTSILGGLALVGLVALVPYSALYVARNRANPCCREKGCFEPCFCDEPAGGAEAAEPAPEPAPAPASWEVAEPEPPAVPPPAEPPAAEAAAAEPAPAEAPAEEWQVVEDEEPQVPALESVQYTPPPPTPALATRPSDPAAPPQDAMAVAAKWAEEDAEAEAELEGSEPRSGSRSSRLGKKPAKKAPAKKPKK